jgi:hypothetical protein
MSEQSTSKTIVSVFQGDQLDSALWSNIASFLTLFEWKIAHLVNKNWNLKICKEALGKVKVLDFSPFWATFSDDPSASSPKIMDFLGENLKSSKIRAISFAFCHNLTDNNLAQWIRTLSLEFRNQITHFNVYFCRKLTNTSVLSIAKAFPNLKYLNLGSCFQLTDNCIAIFAKNSLHLKHLVLSNDEKFTEDVLIDLTSHPSLEIVDIQRTKISKEAVDEYKNMGSKLMILGPGVYIAPPPSANRLQKRNSIPQIA